MRNPLSSSRFRSLFITFVTLLTLVSLATAASAEEVAKETTVKAPEAKKTKTTLPFAPGEKLTYDILVMGARAGSGVLSVVDKRDFRGESVISLAGTLQSEGFWKNLYPVKDTMLSLLSPKTFAPLYTEMKISEKNTKRNIRMSFTGAKNEVSGVKSTDGKIKKFKKKAPAETQDMLSWFYRLRTTDLEVGKSFKFKGHSGNFLYTISCKVDRTEEVWTRLGFMDAYVVDATITRDGSKDFKRETTFWVGTDARRIPIKMAFEFSLGKIEGVLAETHFPEGSGTTTAQVK
ncbi:MAG: DUF3108 domain-containing protein [Myxococcales bacterium]|nr:DUF3108 domain-containing protein [Myxococcales bacterium]